MNRRDKLRYLGLYDGKTSPGEAFSCILNHHLRIIRRNTAGCLRGRDSRYLHDIRVSFRRMRSAVEFFSDLPVMARRRNRLDRLLKKVCLDLGRMRDLQARLELLDNLRFGPDFNHEAYRQKCMADIRKGMPRLRRVVSGTNWAECIAIIRELSRSCQRESHNEDSMRRFAARQILERFAKFKRADFCGVAGRSSDSLHEIRKRFRKLRYHVEVCAPVLGQEMVKLEHLLSTVAGLLGRIHDVDVSEALLTKSSRAADSLRFRKILMGERKSAISKLKAALSKCELAVKGIKAAQG